MTRDDWKKFIRDTVYDADVGDYEALDLLAQVLEEQNLAKQKLRGMGFGCTGMGLLETVGEVQGFLDIVREEIARVRDTFLSKYGNAQ